MLPSRNHAVVLVSKLHQPTLRALAYARATAAVTLEALTVDVDPEDTERAAGGVGRSRGIEVPLLVLDSPYREIVRPVLEYIRDVRRDERRATWSRCSSPSTSSATGGSSCCTTRARCG